MFKSEQSNRLPQLGQVTLQFLSTISTPQRSQRKVRLEDAGRSVPLGAGVEAGETGSGIGPGNGFEQGAVEGGQVFGAEAFHFGEDGGCILAQLGHIHAAAGIGPCA